MQKSQFSAESGYVATGDVMGYLQISRRTLERYVSDGKLTPVYLPTGHRRFSAADVAALLTPSSPVVPSPHCSAGDSGAPERRAS